MLNLRTKGLINRTVIDCIVNVNVGDIVDGVSNASVFKMKHESVNLSVVPRCHSERARQHRHTTGQPAGRQRAVQEKPRRPEP